MCIRDRGTRVAFTPPNGSFMDILVDGTTGMICIQDGSEAEVLESLMELEITAPLHSDDEFSVLLDVRAGSNNTNVLESTVVDVTVLAVADIPSVAAPQIITVEEQGSEIIALSVNSSLDDADDDNSECIFVRLTVASDPTTGDPIGLLSVSYTHLTLPTIHSV